MSKLIMSTYEQTLLYIIIIYTRVVSYSVWKSISYQIVLTAAVCIILVYIYILPRLDAHLLDSYLLVVYINTYIQY